MRTLRNPICNHTAVGVRLPIDPARGVNSAFHVDNGDGTQTLPPPPYAITEDTTILGGIFRQEAPHTPLFTLAPGVVLRILGDGQYINCTLPDEAEVVGFPNLTHGLEAPTGLTGDEDRQAVRLLCECSKCCSAQGELDLMRGLSLADEILGETRDADGRRIHAVGGLKARYKNRRLNPAAVTADRDRQAGANLRAFQKFSPSAKVAAHLAAALKRGQ